MGKMSILNTRVSPNDGKESDISVKSIQEQEIALPQKCYPGISPIEKKQPLNTIVWFITWCFCVSASLYFIHYTYIEYIDSSPLTTFTFIDYPPNPDPVIVKICNSVFLDIEKILNYDGAEFSYDAYEFLYEAASGNHLFDDSNWVVTTSVKDVFFLSARVLEEFKLDVEKFLGSCYVVGTYKDCISHFKLHLDVETLCYQAEIDLGGYGGNLALKLGFFFDPKLHLGKYIEQSGAYVSFSHPTDYLLYSDGFFLEPKDFVRVSATTEHKAQKKSFEKAKCMNAVGPKTYNFTGKSFQVNYHLDYCSNLCLAEAYYEKCQCSPFVGMNLTNSECLEQEHVRSCLKTLGAFPKDIEARSRECLSNCLSKCRQTYLRMKVSRERNKYTKYKMKTLLEDLAVRYNYKSKISTSLLERVNSSADPLAEADIVKEGLSHVTFVRIGFRHHVCLRTIELSRVVRKIPSFGIRIVWGAVPMNFPVFWVSVSRRSLNYGTSPHLWVKKKLIKFR